VSRPLQNLRQAANEADFDRPVFANDIRKLAHIIKHFDKILCPKVNAVSVKTLPDYFIFLVKASNVICVHST
jgi:hypothetical protein